MITLESRRALWAKENTAPGVVVAIPNLFVVLFQTSPEAPLKVLLSLNWSWVLEPPGVEPAPLEIQVPWTEKHPEES